MNSNGDLYIADCSPLPPHVFSLIIVPQGDELRMPQMTDSLDDYAAAKAALDGLHRELRYLNPSAGSSRNTGHIRNLAPEPLVLRISCSFWMIMRYVSSKWRQGSLWQAAKEEDCSPRPHARAAKVVKH
jgi:hypothetical protein